jgi:hypothetical protein
MSFWDQVVTLTLAHEFDRAEVTKALSILFAPGDIHELRGVTPPNFARSRLVSSDKPDDALQRVEELSDSRGLYYTLNPVRASIGDRAARVPDILKRVWFMVDIDRKKLDAPDSMATDAEKDHVFSLTIVVQDYLLSQGWPGPVMVDSGNGVQLLFRIDLPNDKLTQSIISAALKSLAKRFPSPAAEIDTGVHAATQLAKLPGSWARKAENTTDRPWRLTRLLHVPPKLEAVPLGLLQALGEPPRASHYNPWEQVVRGSENRAARYTESIVERTLSRVILANPGNRHNVLYQAACVLGELVSGESRLDEQEARRKLHDAARRVGLPDQEIIQTIDDGLAKGKQSPRKLPPNVMGPQRNGALPPLPPGTKLTIGLDEIKPEVVDWLWEDRVAKRFITIFAGRTSMGKSFVVCDLVARLSQGKPAAFSQLKMGQVRTLFISEDSPTIVLGPRLLNMGADAAMVRFMTFEAMARYTIDDLKMLESAYQECGQPGLIIIDPPSNFLGEVDEHKNAEVRRLLSALIGWLDAHAVACILITHINKQVSNGLNAVERIIGSVAWGSSARVTLAFASDPDQQDQYVCGGTKNNIGPLAGTLEYKIVNQAGIVKIEWIGPTTSTMEDALKGIKKQNRGTRAVEWLKERFRERPEWDARDLGQAADHDGISNNALYAPEVTALKIAKLLTYDRQYRPNGTSYVIWKALNGWPGPKQAP